MNIHIYCTYNYCAREHGWSITTLIRGLYIRWGEYVSFSFTDLNLTVRSLGLSELIVIHLLAFGRTEYTYCTLDVM